MDDATLERRVDRLTNGARAAADVLAAYRAGRPGASNDDLWSAVMTDAVFRVPAVRLVETLASRGQDAWLYRFDHEATAFGGALGACHAVDVPFVFDNLHRRGADVFLGEIDDDARALASATSRAWIATARSHDPNHDGLPDWPRYDTDRRATMVLGHPSALADDPAGAERAVWDGVI
jgi:para-nitrobenzyl esterase